LFHERSLLAHPARNACARFLVFSARTDLIGNGSNGSIWPVRQVMQDDRYLRISALPMGARERREST
jgi:hypothetical protein